MWYLVSEDEPSAKAEGEAFEPKEGRGRKRAGKKKTGAQKKRERAAREEGPERIWRMQGSIWSNDDVTEAVMGACQTGGL